MKNILPGRFWAYVGTIGGVAVSAGANYGETSMNPAIPEAVKAWAALLMALLPVGLFVALEVLVRNRIKEHINWWRGGMLVTAFAFAIPSYSHMHDLLVDWKQNDAICIVTPLGFDGLMLLSTLALLLDPHKKDDEEPAPPLLTVIDYAITIPAPPPVVRTVITAPRAKPTDTVTARVRKAPQRTRSTKTGATNRRFARPTDHPMFAQWHEAETSGQPWSDEEFAERSGKNRNAARVQAGRWRTWLADNPLAVTE